MRRLQKLLIRSWTARALAVRRVTQDNQGKKTAGVDGVKSLSPKQRLTLVNQIKLGSKVKPTRRIWLAKPGTDEKRPLGIPTIEDRALQALVKLGLEPEWEARFEPNSYGFRPGRSCHDAIGAIFNTINAQAKYVLDADISKCFDRINHEELLSKLNTYPTLRRQIRAWLKAGVMEGKKLFPTKSGTPQGGVISPLLANIALHGIEELIKGLAPKFDIWLSGIGLELNPSKTRIAHTLKPINNEEPGFNFLGFNVRQFPVGKYRSGKNGAGKLLGFKTIITPSKESQKRHYRKAAEVINKSRGLSQAILIKRLNPIIRGWCSYFSTVVSQKVLERLGRLIFWKFWKWGVRRHPNKNRRWIRQKYFKTIEGNNWAFATKAGKNSLVLRQHSSTEIKRHIKVKGNASPYDGNWVYWSIRMGKHPEITVKVAKLLKQQKGKCAHCGSYFKDGESLEVDHIIPKSKGGKERNNNWQLLHRHCHDKKTSTDGSFGNKSSCNSAKPKPPIEPGKYIWENDMLVMTF